jgi:hypothetical protein
MYGVDMKTKRKLFVTVFLLLAVSYVWAAKWTVDSFDPAADSYEADNYITGEFSGSLKIVQPGQVTQQNGRLYVRQKFEDPFGVEEPTYQIFQGRPKEAAKDLGKVSLEGIPYTTLIKMKLFYSKTATGDDDLETVYYDGKDIFVEGEDPVYINLNGRMEELKPIVSKEYKVTVTSEPSGATVTVGNVSKGVTPVTFSVSSTKTVAAVVSKEGYYTVIKAVTPADKQTVQEGVLLTTKKPLDNPATAYRSQLQAATAAKDANAIKNLKTSIQQSINNYNTESKKSIEAVMSKFPANSPKTASESATDDSARQSLWTNTQSKERESLNNDAKNYLTELKDLLTEVDAGLGDMDFALKYEYIPSSAVTINNLGIKDFSLDAELSNSRVKFNYSKAKLAYGSVPRNELAQDQENVHGVLKIWNNPNESGKFASIYDIAFFYNETPLKILTKGNFTMSEATVASRNTERDLNARIAKYSGRTAWNKRDSVATLAALRAGEIPDAQTIAAKQDEAEYDEDEDDDEFDDEMEEQEKQDYSRYGAAGNATDIFGNTDEYLFWAGVAFAAAAIGTGVVGFLENSKYSDSDNKIKKLEEDKEDVLKGIDCKSMDEASCKYIIENGGTNAAGDPFKGTKEFDKNIEAGKKVRDSYNTSRIIWFSAAGASAALSIVLFAW